MQVLRYESVFENGRTIMNDPKDNIEKCIWKALLKQKKEKREFDFVSEKLRNCIYTCDGYRKECRYYICGG